MQKFRYSMQSLLVIKQKLEDQAKAAYGAAKLRLSEEQEKLLVLIQQKENYLNEKSEVLSKRLDVPKLNLLQNAVETMDGKIERQKANIRRAEAAVSAAEARLLDAMTERKTQEKLRENAFEQYRQELNAEEQKEIDERTSFLYGTGDMEEA